jgi:hypothetical protein
MGTKLGILAHMTHEIVCRTLFLLRYYPYPYLLKFPKGVFDVFYYWHVFAYAMEASKLSGTSSDP